MSITRSCATSLTYGAESHPAPKEQVGTRLKRLLRLAAYAHTRVMDVARNHRSSRTHFRPSSGTTVTPLQRLTTTDSRRVQDCFSSRGTSECFSSVLVQILSVDRNILRRALPNGLQLSLGGFALHGFPGPVQPGTPDAATNHAFGYGIFTLCYHGIAFIQPRFP